MLHDATTTFCLYGTPKAPVLVEVWYDDEPLGCSGIRTSRYWPKEGNANNTNNIKLIILIFINIYQKFMQTKNVHYTSLFQPNAHCKYLNNSATLYSLGCLHTLIRTSYDTSIILTFTLRNKNPLQNSEWLASDSAGIFLFSTTIISEHPRKTTPWTAAPLRSPDQSPSWNIRRP